MNNLSILNVKNHLNGKTITIKKGKLRKTYDL